jgi:small-conductance mechanosensitive channel
MARVEISVRFVVALLLSFLLATAAAARTASPTDASEAALAEAKADLSRAAAGVGGKELADSDIEARLASLPPIQARLAQILGGLTPRLHDLQARQAQLGAVGPGLPVVDPRTVQIKHDLEQRLASVTADIQEARDLTLRADQISADLSERLRENFAARLWTRSRSILDPGLWRDFAAALPGDAERLARSVRDEDLQGGWSAARTARDLALLALAALASVMLLGPGRLFLYRVGYHRAARAGGAAHLRRIVLALWLVAVSVAAPLLAGLLVRAALTEVGALTPDIDQVTALTIRVMVFAALVASLGRALLSPGRPVWRLAPVPEAIVARLAPFPRLIGLTAALSTFVAGLNTLLGASLASRVATDCLAMLVELAAVGGGLAAVGRARVERLAMAAQEPTASERDSRLPWVLAILAAWAAVAGALVAVLVGYLAMAEFLINETVWIGAILGLLFLMLRLADDLFPALLSPGAPLGGALETALGIGAGPLEQVAVLMSGVVRLALYLLAWVAVLAPFGASMEDILRRFTATDFVVRLGLVAISPGAILGGVALFLVGLVITRGVRRWLEVRFLPKTDLDVGLRTSLAAGVSYLGVLVAVLVAFAYLGLSIAQIALFASALSVGIGFGLQGVIANFVAGLVLLAERPVRVGDWIAIGELEGDVRKISIRATEIEMLDHSRLIVPNSELVSKTVRNITHSGALGRVKLVLRVDAAADPARVHDILLAPLQAHAEVLKDPPPAVYMTDARDAGLEFTAFAYLISPRLAYRVKSELLFQIVPDLKAAGIALASSTPVVNVGLADRLIDPEPSTGPRPQSPRSDSPTVGRMRPPPP